MSAINEIKSGDRFAFGGNWKNYLGTLDDERIQNAKQALSGMLGVDNLQNKTFLDIGSGSGLHSLVARILGARVLSIDYDEESIICTKSLKDRYFKDDTEWTIQQGSVLDVEFIKSLGTFDIVYSWGVLHHTGNLQGALENVNIPVRSNGGVLFISIYNYQMYWSAYWTFVKRTYNKYVLAKVFWLLFYYFVFIIRRLIKYVLTFKHLLRRRIDYKRNRGMSLFYDLKDWVGGYPFETAKPEEIFNFFRDRGFSLKELYTCGARHGCNEFVFIKS